MTFWFFPLGIADVRTGGGGKHVHLSCGCVIVYVGMKSTKRKGMLTICWEHDGYWPMVDASRWAAASPGHLN